MQFLGSQIENEKMPFFVAEISGNHEGNLEKLLDLISKAKNIGADAVKLQVYTASEMTINSKLPDFIVKEGIWKGINLYELYTKYSLPKEWVVEAFEYAYKIGIPIFASVFGEESLNFLEKIGCQAYKIASFENNDIYFVNKVIDTGKPILISTGTLSLDQIEYFMWNCWKQPNVAIMHCVSAYPTSLRGANLNRILKLREKFKDTVIGYSDHTVGSRAVEYACAMGAAIIEKHLSHTNNTIDSSFSAVIPSFEHLICFGKLAWASAYEGSDINESKSFQFKRSLYAVKDIKTGEVFTYENVKSIRPGFGAVPTILPVVIGVKAIKDINCGEPITNNNAYIGNQHE